MASCRLHPRPVLAAAAQVYLGGRNQRGMRARLTKDFRFESAQTLPKAPEGHKCRQMHGHSFKVEVSIEGEVDPQTCWIYDHAQISAAMKPLLEQLDHSYLNEITGLVD